MPNTRHGSLRENDTQDAYDSSDVHDTTWRPAPRCCSCRHELQRCGRFLENRLQISNNVLNDPKAYGRCVLGSFAIVEQVNACGSCSRASGTKRILPAGIMITFDQPHLSIGYLLPLNEHVDFTTDVS